MKKRAAISPPGCLLSLWDFFHRKPSRGPSYLFHDTFTDTDNTLLPNHAPDIDNLTGGNGWQSGYYNEIAVVNNAMAKTGTHPALVYLQPGIGFGSAPYTIEFDIYVPSTETNYLYFYFPYADQVSGHYMLLRIDPSLSNDIYLTAKINNSNVWTKTFANLSDWFTLDAWNTMRFEIIKDQTAIYCKVYVNDVLKADSSPSGDNVDLSGMNTSNTRLEWDFETSAGYKIDNLKVY